MDCDLTSLAAFKGQARPSPAQSGSCLDSCRACLRGLEGRARLLPVLGGALGAAVGSSRCPSRSHPLCFPGPAWVRQPGTAGRTCDSGGELFGEASPRGGRGAGEGARGAGGCPSPGAWAFLLPLPLAGTVSDRGASILQSVTPARGSSSSSSALPSPPQRS